ncbi:hypothetical protein [Kineococcus rubinsiae]|uniref:hypothetical protein n=1 Tax=Kineococcus rubinsiae TaxID=2609562 RepID=UPI00143017FE|nr:hypothetical protein [Kineococcus rubinsiae]NIZ92906.1 hypothetical protein [Kineococcus rubinsiae]
MGARLPDGVRRWLTSSVAVPLGARALTNIADRLERAEGPSVTSRALRGASRAAGRRGRRTREGGKSAR